MGVCVLVLSLLALDFAAGRRSTSRRAGVTAVLPTPASKRFIPIVAAGAAAAISVPGAQALQVQPVGYKTSETSAQTAGDKIAPSASHGGSVSVSDLVAPFSASLTAANAAMVKRSISRSKRAFNAASAAILSSRDDRLSRSFMSRILPFAAMFPRRALAAGFVRLPQIQFIAALGDPQASSGSGAGQWGIWRVDPGPRGVMLRDYPRLEEAGGEAPAKWRFDRNDWWLEEHGLIMEKPDFPVLPGRYMVTGGREKTVPLTISADGSWKLDGGAKLYDVTHLPCRAARYKPATADASPLNARQEDFPVTPGAAMPAVEGTNKQD